jgi:hypothetical protein
MESLIAKLRKDFPALSFAAGEDHFWSPHKKRITYTIEDQSDSSNKYWSLLHEVGHAILGHQTYKSDFELLQLEVAAWEKACSLAKRYGLSVDEDHIQNCLDSYRDWLHRRSTCPVCGNHSLQDSARSYQCFNCQTRWGVSVSRFCRPYRRLQLKTTA